MTKDRIDAIRARVLATTGGTWEAVIEKDGRHDNRIVTETYDIAEVWGGAPESENNRQFIAHAHQDIPDLLDEIDATQALLRQCRDALELTYATDGTQRKMQAINALDRALSTKGGQ